MSSTEQKNVTQPFMDACYTFGILPTIITQAFDDYELRTGEAPFNDLDCTPNLGRRIRQADDPIALATGLLPSLSNAAAVTRVSPLLLKLCSDATVYSGNSAVLRLCKSIAMHRWNMHVKETPGVKHAKLHAAKVVSLLAPGAYSNLERASRNAIRLAHSGLAAYLRSSAELIDYISKQNNTQLYSHSIRSWCSDARDATGFDASYYKNTHALEAYGRFDPKTIYEFEDPPALKQKWITVPKTSQSSLSIYRYGSTIFIKVVYKSTNRSRCTLFSPGNAKATKKDQVGVRRTLDNELYVLSRRDMSDLSFILHACSHYHMYTERRFHDVLLDSVKYKVKRVVIMMWSLYLKVMEVCGQQHQLRNKLGVYFDVLQWRYLAWRSGNEFYNHSAIMAGKIKSKGLERMPDQCEMLTYLKDIPIDIAIDLLGIYKASIYPEVDPFKVVVEQYALHMSRFITDWEVGSPEHERFQDTKAYMWYLGIRVLWARNHIWPGRVRNGVEPKDWHNQYNTNGIPSTHWRDAHDIDLSRCVPVADISNEQYMRQQDSACAPPLLSEYDSFLSLKKAPRRHRRKLLYAVQEPTPPDLRGVLGKLNEIGCKLRDGHVDGVEHDLDFSTDIITGSRCERHKDAPRPFYASCPPWGCIISYFDGITRDFLNNVPQSMLGKSTKQKFTDIADSGRACQPSTEAFYMSDDKAKYSPRMDPQSQQLPADFFAELFGIPGIKAYGPIMYHCRLYYRVCGHLVYYGANGTDREGMRGASNTWLEIVAQGLTTRLSRDRGLILGKSQFLSFIDDGLRKFAVSTRNRSPSEVYDTARLVIDDVIFGLKVLGRELSWDKTFISKNLFVILNEIVYSGANVSGGMKSFITAGDIEMKEVMCAADYEQLYFGKMRGAHGVGAPLDLCHYVYVFETILSHYLMGVSMQNNRLSTNFEYRMFCITPLALGGGGIRSSLQLACNEVANATQEGVGVLMRLGSDKQILSPCIHRIISQPLEQLNPIDFMREPSQCHVAAPRVRTQRLAAEVRKRLKSIANNELSMRYLELDELGLEILARQGRAIMASGDVSAEDVRLFYSLSPVAFIDEFIQKLASSTTLSEILGRDTIGGMRRAVRRDIRDSVNAFRERMGSEHIFETMRRDIDVLASIHYLMR